MNRRSFLRTGLSAGLPAGATLAARQCFADEVPATIGPLETFVPCRAITSEPKHHWFGYYDKREFSGDGRFVLSNQVSFEGRSPTASDTIKVGYVDTERDDQWVPLGESRAWGWQQGCMLQFVDAKGEKLLWNDREGDQFVCRLFDRKSSTPTTIDHPIYTVSPDGRTGLSVDFRRINNLRPGYGYSDLPDPFVDQNAPSQSGIWNVDLQTGHSDLILSLAHVASLPWPDGQTHAEAWHYFNHLLINPSGNRFTVLHRYRPKFDPRTRTYEGQFVTRMLTANLDGSDLYVLDPSGHTSHFVWKDDQVLTMFTKPAGRKYRFYDFRDRTDDVQPVGHDVMTSNGHNTYLSGDYGDWILNDTYPSKKTSRQTVYLYHPESGRRFDLGHFPSPRSYRGEWRCDTHPRSNADGTMVAIDSPHNGGRQVYLLDIKSLLERHS